MNNSNGGAPRLAELTWEQYDQLKRSGLLHEFYPMATGEYKKDVKIDTILNPTKRV